MNLEFGCGSSAYLLYNLHRCAEDFKASSRRRLLRITSGREKKERKQSHRTDAERSELNPPWAIAFKLILKFQNISLVLLLKNGDFPILMTEFRFDNLYSFLKVILIGSLPRETLVALSSSVVLCMFSDTAVLLAIVLSTIIS